MLVKQACWKRRALANASLLPKRQPANLPPDCKRACKVDHITSTSLCVHIRQGLKVYHVPYYAFVSQPQAPGLP